MNEVVFTEDDTWSAIDILGDTSSVSSSAVVGETVLAPINGTSAFKVTADGELKRQWNNPKMRPASMSTIVGGGRLD